MGLVAKAKGDGDFAPPAPEGTHVGRCIWLVDLGTHFNQQFGKRQRRVMLGWELPDELITEGERAGEPYFVRREYNLVLGERASLRQDLEKWRKKKFTDDELEGFDLRAILDKPCMVTVTHNVKPDRTYANVTGVSSLLKNVECPQRVNPIRQFDLDEPDWDVYRALPEWLRNKIDASEERSKAPGAEGSEEPPPYTDADIPADEPDDLPVF